MATEIITGPGEYRTLDGRKAHVTHFDSGGAYSRPRWIGVIEGNDHSINGWASCGSRVDKHYSTHKEDEIVSKWGGNHCFEDALKLLENGFSVFFVYGHQKRYMLKDDDGSLFLTWIGDLGNTIKRVLQVGDTRRTDWIIEPKEIDWRAELIEACKLLKANTGIYSAQDRGTIGPEDLFLDRPHIKALLEGGE